MLLYDALHGAFCQKVPINRIMWMSNVGDSFHLNFGPVSILYLVILLVHLKFLLSD